MTLSELKKLADKCTTHHHACDCREYRLNKAIEKMQKALLKIDSDRCVRPNGAVMQDIRTWTAELRRLAGGDKGQS